MRRSLVLARILSGRLAPVDLEPGDLIELVHVANRAGLAPALWAHGTRSGWWQPIPSDAARLVSAHSQGPFGQPELALQRAFEDNEARIDDLLLQGASIETAFGKAGVESVRLKGWHTITANWWASSAERTMTDLDVLVDASDADRAAAVLIGLGYQPIESGHTDFADHELPPVHLPGHPGSVEIHTALAVRRWAAVLPAGDVLERGGPMTATDAVTHLIVHAQLHDEGHLLAIAPLRALYETAVVSRLELAAEIEWDVVRSRFAAVGAEHALDSFLALARSLFDADVPVPRRRGGVHAALATALLDRPRSAAWYAKAAFLPRAMGADRMRSLSPGRPVWRTRLTWLAGGVSAGLGRQPRSGREFPSDVADQ